MNDEYVRQELLKIIKQIEAESGKACNETDYNVMIFGCEKAIDYIKQFELPAKLQVVPSGLLSLEDTKVYVMPIWSYKPTYYPYKTIPYEDLDWTTKLRFYW
jgi:hypothetical protein